MKLKLSNGNILDEKGLITKNINIYIEEEKIKLISNDDIPGFDEIDCTDKYITPGFVNLHTHSPMNILKGIAEDISIDKWFNEKIFPYESKLTEEDIYWGTTIASCEMLDNGVTAFADHYFAPQAVYKAVEDIGIRADIAPTIFGLASDYEKQLKDAIGFIEDKQGKNNRISLRLGPHAPYTCPGKKLKEIIDAAKKLKVGIHLHMSETKDQVLDSIKNTNKTPVEVLYDSGGFDIDLIIAHGLWTTQDDLRFISDKAYFAFCPKTYMKLSMGEGNIYTIKDSINYSFGTDGAASSNTLSPLEQSRLFALNGKFIKNNAEAFNVIDTWKALMNGHNALSFNTGKIKEGYGADLLIWDLNKLNTYPVYDPLTSIIYSSTSENIISTMVQGRLLKHNGKLLIDTNDILKKVGKIQNNILLRGKGVSKISY